MKAININGEIKVFQELPVDWKHYLNFREAPNELQKQEGFYDLVVPHYDPDLQRLGEIFFDSGNEIFTYPVIDKTVEELAAEKEALLQSIESKFDVASIKRLLIILTKNILNNTEVKQQELDDLASIYQQYRIGRFYQSGEVFVYDGELYIVNDGQDHTSQADWIPSTTRSLYRKFTPTGVIAEWIQPLGALDAYPLGSKVTHNSKTWESTVNNNVWEPGVYGWTEIP